MAIHRIFNEKPLETFQMHLLKNHTPINQPLMGPWCHQAFEHELMDVPFDEQHECNGLFDWDQLDEAHWWASSNEIIFNEKSSGSN